MVHGIPDFRLPKDTVEDAIHKILDLGIEVILGKELGKDISLRELQEEYDAILLSFGANISSKMHIEGEEMDGVYGGNELLEYGNYPDFRNKKVAVIGGGNTAMDAARAIKRMNAKDVFVIYRRAREQMPAEDLEVQAAMDEGISFLFQNNIVKVLGKEKVEGVECIKTELIKVQGDRDKPVDIEGSNYNLDLDFVIMALGAKPNKKVLESLNLELNDWGYIKVNDNYVTSMENIFACGDLIGAKSTVAWASRSGREAAISIYEKLVNG